MTVAEPIGREQVAAAVRALEEYGFGPYGGMASAAPYDDAMVCAVIRVIDALGLTYQSPSSPAVS